MVRNSGWLVGSAALLLAHCAPVEVVAPARDASAAQAPEGAPAARSSVAAERGAGEVGHDAAESTRDLMEFIGIGRGERIADLGAGAGYSILHMAEAVGPSGVVYTRHDPRPLSAPAKPGATTEHEGTLPENIVVMSTPDSAPFSAAARDLDLVTLLFAYSDLVEHGRDRLAFNRAVFAALAPDRFYIVASHDPSPQAAGGAGRVGEELVRRDVEAAGFVFVEAAQLLPSNAHAEAASSQYVLKFRKPK